MAALAAFNAQPLLVGWTEKYSHKPATVLESVLTSVTAFPGIGALTMIRLNSDSNLLRGVLDEKAFSALGQKQQTAAPAKGTSSSLCNSVTGDIYHLGLRYVLIRIN